MNSKRPSFALNQGEHVFHPGEHCQKYRITGFVGEGGMGVVYEGHDDFLDRRLAIKIIRGRHHPTSPLFVAHQKSTRLVTHLEHPNIVKVFDAGLLPDGTMYVVMEFIEGCSLHELLECYKELEYPTALTIAIQIVDGLRVAHAIKVVHRDLKPDNVIVTEYAHIKVVDFGTATRLGGKATTDPFKDIMTALFTSPEQVAQRQATPASDIYSLGIVLFLMVTGWYVYGDRTGRFPPVADALHNHLHARPKSLQDAMPGFNQPRIGDLLARMLHKDPTRRPTAQQVFETLNEELNEYRAINPYARDWMWSPPSNPHDAEGREPSDSTPAHGSGLRGLLSRISSKLSGHGTAPLPSRFRPDSWGLPFPKPGHKPPSQPLPPQVRWTQTLRMPSAPTHPQPPSSPSLEHVPASAADDAPSSSSLQPKASSPSSSSLQPKASSLLPTGPLPSVPAALVATVPMAPLLSALETDGVEPQAATNHPSKTRTSSPLALSQRHTMPIPRRVRRTALGVAVLIGFAVSIALGVSLKPHAPKADTSVAEHPAVPTSLPDPSATASEPDVSAAPTEEANSEPAATQSASVTEKPPVTPPMPKAAPKSNSSKGLPLPGPLIFDDDLPTKPSSTSRPSTPSPTPTNAPSPKPTHEPPPRPF